MNIQNIVSQSNLELVVCALVAVAALRVITAISFRAGRKAGQAAVFSAVEALEEARDAARRAREGVESSRKWLEHRREEEARVKNNWTKYTYEHRSYVVDQATSAERSLQRALQEQKDADIALNNAREALEALK